MNNSSNKQAVMVGLFVFLGIVFLFAGILMVGNLHNTFTSKIRVVSLFEDVNGLQKGNNVWFSGVKVGTVGKMHIYGESKVVVDLKIDSDVQEFIQKDAKIKISTDGLIGNKILVIYGGSANSGMVQEGDTIHVEKTLSTEEMLITLQENNHNLLEITTDFKTISKKLTTSDGTLGKLLNDNALYDNMNEATVSFKKSAHSLEKITKTTQDVAESLRSFSDNLHNKGTLAHELVTDTSVFHSIKSTAKQVENIADTAQLFISDLKRISTNPNSSVGVLLHDEKSGTHIKNTLENLEYGSEKLDENLEALQHNFLLRRYFKKKEKSKKE